MLVSAGGPVLSARSSTGETLGCSAAVRGLEGPEWVGGCFPGCSTGTLTLWSVLCPQPVTVTLVG